MSVTTDLWRIIADERVLPIPGRAGGIGEQGSPHSGPPGAAASGGVPGRCRQVVARKNSPHLPEEKLHLHPA